MFRTLSDRTTVVEEEMILAFHVHNDIGQNGHGASSTSTPSLTFIFANVFQGERETGIFALDDSNFAKGSFADDTKQSKVVEVHYWRHTVSGDGCGGIDTSAGCSSPKDGILKSYNGTHVFLIGDVGQLTFISEHDWLALRIAHGGRSEAVP